MPLTIANRPCPPWLTAKMGMIWLRKIDSVSSRSRKDINAEVLVCDRRGERSVESSENQGGHARRLRSLADRVRAVPSPAMARTVCPPTASWQGDPGNGIVRA